MTSNSSRSQYDGTPKKVEQRVPTSKAKQQPETEASSSGLPLEERARSLLLPTTDEAGDVVPRERVPKADQ